MDPYDLNATFMKNANIIESIIIDQICQKVLSRNDSLYFSVDRSEIRVTPSSSSLADLTLLPNEATDLRNFLLLLALYELLTEETLFYLLCPNSIVRLLFHVGDYSGVATYL